MNSSKTTRALVESAMMISLATVLSIFKLVDMPYGGSVTVASAFPLLVLSYRLGLAWGIGSGFVYSAVQQLLGLSNLSYVTGWQSVLAVILLDYIVAFTFIGFGGVFRKICKTQQSALVFGALLVSILRFICHIISGATVWAGLSIPSEAAIIYSIGYNATYMLPETVILIAVSYYLGGIIDFSKTTPVRSAEMRARGGDPSYYIGSGAFFILGILTDTWLIAPKLQDGETGEFIISGLAEVNWIAAVTVTVICLAAGIALLVLAKQKKEKQ